MDAILTDGVNIAKNTGNPSPLNVDNIKKTEERGRSTELLIVCRMSLAGK